MVPNIGKSKPPKSCENRLGEGLIEGNGAKCCVAAADVLVSADDEDPTFQFNSGILLEELEAFSDETLG